MGRRTWFWLVLVIVCGAGWAGFTLQPGNFAILRWSLIVGVAAPLVVVLITLGEKQPAWRLDDAPAQLNRIARYLLFLLLANLLVWPVWNALPNVVRYSIAEGVYLLTWTVIPVALLWRGVWTWPRIPERSGRVRLAAVAVFAFALMATLGLFMTPQRPEEPSVLLVGASLLDTLIAAISEELVFRVMLLSYLCAVLKSPLSALAISAVVFSVFHVPYDLVTHSDLPLAPWDPLLLVIPVGRFTVGFFLGALWLRTRSLAIVGVAHALMNVFVGLMELAIVWA